jgi:peptidoglycan/xylan/chitin deacetylase (PgdA/CDA1 family)
MKVAAKWVAGLASRAPLVPDALLAMTRPGRYLILTYHRVNDDGHPFFEGTPPALFRAQLESLRRHFAVLPLAELASRARSGPIPKNAIALTFDDGYRDNYTHAFPVLRELGLPATLFLTTDAVDHDRMIWHDRVFDAFHRTRAQALRWNGAVHPFSTPAEKERALTSVLSKLRSSSPEARDRLIEELLAELEVDPSEARGWEKLRWDDAREMARCGVSFGAHSLDHPILTRVGADEARRQIRESKRRIEAELGLEVTAFAYPNGDASDFDASTEKILEEEGFSLAVSTIFGANDASTDPYALRRVGLWGDPRLTALRLGWSRLRS